MRRYATARSGSGSSVAGTANRALLETSHGARVDLREALATFGKPDP